jgi:hypothetical protein
MVAAVVLRDAVGVVPDMMPAVMAMMLGSVSRASV